MFVAWMLFTRTLSAFQSFVAHVVSLRPEKQMSGIHTRGIVASVKYMLPPNFTAINLPRYAMCPRTNKAVTAHGELAIATVC
jgi:hypothetical protein